MQLASRAAKAPKIGPSPPTSCRANGREWDSWRSDRDYSPQRVVPAEALVNCFFSNGSKAGLAGVFAGQVHRIRGRGKNLIRFRAGRGGRPRVRETNRRKARGEQPLRRGNSFQKLEIQLKRT